MAFWSPVYGAVAQLEERLHGMQEVVGSNPIGSTRLRCELRESRSLPRRMEPATEAGPRRSPSSSLSSTPGQAHDRLPLRLHPPFEVRSTPLCGVDPRPHSENEETQ